MPKRTRTRKPKTRSIPKKREYELPGDGRTFSYIVPRPHAPLKIGEQIHSMTQTVTVLAFHTGNVAIATFSAVQFQLADVDQYASLAAVFDQYRFNSIEAWIEPQGSNLNITNTGRIYSVLDFDDATALTTTGQAMDYTNVLVSGGQSCQYRRFRPHIAVAAYTGAFGGFKNEVADWLDAVSSTVKHYGLKFAADASSTAQVYDLTLKYHLSFRNVR